MQGERRECSVGAASAAGVTGASECESGGLRLVVWARPGRTHCDQAATTVSSPNFDSNSSWKNRLEIKWCLSSG